SVRDQRAVSGGQPQTLRQLTHVTVKPAPVQVHKHLSQRLGVEVASGHQFSSVDEAPFGSAWPHIHEDRVAKLGTTNETLTRTESGHTVPQLAYDISARLLHRIEV